MLTKMYLMYIGKETGEKLKFMAALSDCPNYKLLVSSGRGCLIRDTEK